MVSSAYKRHSKILEAAIFERLRDNNRLSVWTDPAFKVSAAAEALVDSSPRPDCFRAQLPYGDTKRTVQVDIVVYDNLQRSLRAYEVKRGNGEHDAGKVRSIMRDLICTHVLLKSYGHSTTQRFISMSSTMALPRLRSASGAAIRWIWHDVVGSLTQH